MRPDGVSPGQTPGTMVTSDCLVAAAPDARGQRIWEMVSRSSLASLWDLQGVPPMVVVKRTFKSFNDDNLLDRAAELGYYFLFALFPMLISASSILGLAARSASAIYFNLLNYLALVVPHAALGIVLDTFNQTTAHASGGKITFGLAVALWSASVGFSAIQDTLNTVYKVPETRPFWRARGEAILVTLLLMVIATLMLAALFAGNFMARGMEAHAEYHDLASIGGVLARLVTGGVAAGLLILSFAVIYYFAPNVEHKRWRWLTPGGAIGILGWFAASIALRVYLFYFNSYSLTYGSLGAVMILLLWFYITGLMILLGAEINSEIAAAVIEKKLTGVTPGVGG